MIHNKKFAFHVLFLILWSFVWLLIVSIWYNKKVLKSEYHPPQVNIHVQVQGTSTNWQHNSACACSKWGECTWVIVDCCCWSCFFVFFIYFTVLALVRFTIVLESGGELATTNIVNLYTYMCMFKVRNLCHSMIIIGCCAKLKKNLSLFIHALGRYLFRLIFFTFVFLAYYAILDMLIVEGLYADL